MIGQSKKSGIEIESEYQLTGHPVFVLLDKVNALKHSFKGKHFVMYVLTKQFCR